MGSAGLLRAAVPKAHGGLTAAVRSMPLAVAREELARLSPLADTLYAMQGLGSFPVAGYRDQAWTSARAR